MTDVVRSPEPSAPVILPTCSFRRPLPVVASAALVLALAARPGPSAAMEVQCGSEGGDAFGWALAAGGDWNGDAVEDFAVGAPCAAVGVDLRVGRVKVFSGKDGALLESMKGGEAEQRFGSSLAWLPDLDGDGRADLAVGSSTFNAPKQGGGFLLLAGKVEVFSSTGPVLWTAYGANGSAALGESLAVIPDANGDGKSDLVAGASATSVQGQGRPGTGYLLSGATGAKIAQNDGVKDQQQWASVVGTAGDLDGDGTTDWLLATRVGAPAGDENAPVATTTTLVTTTSTTTTTTTLLPRAGQLTVISGKSPYAPLRTYRGETWVHRLGRAAGSAGEVSGDAFDDLWIGSPGAEPGALEDAGVVQLFSGDGPVLREVLEPSPQKFAAFGTALVVPGSLDGGSVDDLVASAPLGKVQTVSEAGRVHAFRGENGDWLWTRSGSYPLERFGQTLASGLDFNDDGTPDVLVGAPGSTPAGRRGAGAATVLNGLDGSPLASFGGRRGRESRVFVSGRGLDRRAVVRSYDPFGQRREAEIRPFPDQKASALSMGALDDGRRGETENGSTALLAVGTGAGGGSANVAVYRMTRRRHRVSYFAAGPDGYAGGLNLTGGDFASDLYGDEIAVVPADPTDGPIPVVIWRKSFGPDPFGRIQWTKVREFPAFSPEDEVEGVPINAVGASLASANLTTNEQDEIVATPLAGLPVVRIFSRIGTLVGEWQAYSVDSGGLENNSGIRASIGNLDGEGSMEIVTAPARGQSWVRAWNIDGTPWEYESGKPVSFFVSQYGSTYTGGLVVTTADVDFDGLDEIVVAPAGGLAARILAFEPNGTPVSGWETIEPFGPSVGGGVGLLGFDQFWKR